MTPSSSAQNIVHESTEVRRILASALLACLLFVLSVFLDGPVSILAWVLLAAGFLCLTYIVVASRYLLNHLRSQNQKTEQQ